MSVDQIFEYVEGGDRTLLEERIYMAIDDAIEIDNISPEKVIATIEQVNFFKGLDYFIAKNLEEVDIAYELNLAKSYPITCEIRENVQKKSLFIFMVIRDRAVRDKLKLGKMSLEEIEAALEDEDFICAMYLFVRLVLSGYTVDQFSTKINLPLKLKPAKKQASCFVK